MTADSSAVPRRTLFVGRERELARLTAALDDAIAGRGSVVAVTGEPGIGKTRLVQELERLATARGVPVHWGRTPESESAPYWPWIRAIRSLTVGMDAEQLQPVLHLHRDALLRLFPELSLDGIAPAAPSKGDEGAQLRLFDGVTSLVTAAAKLAPVILALEDIHWADGASLALLRYLAPEISRVPLLIVVTFRAEEVGLRPALSETVASLARLAHFQAIELAGLPPSAVRRYLSETAAGDLPDDVVSAMLDRAQGNPFFLSEMAALGVAETGAAIPTTVRAAIERRLARLPTGCSDQLVMAAVAGRSFHLDLLAGMTGETDDQLLDLLDEALRAGILEEGNRAGLYRFHHALVREALLDRLSATRRARLHGEIGEVLERAPDGRGEGSAARLAHHFSESATLTEAHAEKARSYALLAARQAEQQAAWAEAVRWYEAAIAGEHAPAPEILAALALAYEAAEPVGERSWALFLRALEAFRRQGDADGFATAVASAPPFLANPSAVQPLVAEAVAVPHGLSPLLNLRLRVQLVGINYDARRNLDDVDEPRGLDQEIRALAEAVGADERDAALGQLDGYRQAARGELVQGADSFARASRADERVGRLQEANFLLARAALLRLTHGDLEEARSLSTTLLEANPRTRFARGSASAFMILSSIANLRWQLNELDRLVGIAEQGAGVFGGPPSNLRVTVRELQGQPEEGWSRVLLGDQPMHHMAECGFRAAAAANAGDGERCRRYLQEWLDLWLAGAGDVTNRANSFAEAALFLPYLDAGEDVLRRIYDEVRPWKNWVGYGLGLGLDPARGQLALRLGLVDEAEQAFRDGVEWAEREGCPVELGRNLQGLAAVAERRKDVPDALAFLDRAAGQYEPRGIKLYLEEVLVRREVLLAATSRPSYPDRLTPREVEVLQLLAGGMTNQQIAGQLVLSVNTVARHVNHIYTKAGVANRAEAATYAHRHGLVE